MKKVFLVILSIISLVVAFSAILFFRYNSWKNDFLSKNNDISCFSNISENDNSENISKKIKNFVLSSSDTYLEFSIDETLSFLHNDVKVSENMNFEDICINPDRGEWLVYLDTKVENFDIPWIKLNIIKDDRETSELYVKDISLGDIKIPDIIGKKIIDEINRGISDGILIVNENNFLGKDIKNIELLNDGVVIR